MLLSIVGVLVIISVISAIAGGGDDTGTSSADQNSNAKAGDDSAGGSTDAAEDAGDTSNKAKVASVGDVVRDGKFTFKVTRIKTASQVGSGYLSHKAQGKYVMVYLTVKNHGGEAQSMFGDNQYLFTPDGKRYSADTEAAIYMGDAGSIYDQINPGNSLKGIVVFDVPKKVKPSRIELHDSAFSGGVDVAL